VQAPDLVDKIMLYECGDLPAPDIIPFFQELINTGYAWKLQGGYSDRALSLIEQGYCVRRQT